MRRIKRTYWAAAVIAALALGGWSCARKAPDIATGMARQSFDSWVAKYAPAAFANPYKDIYIEFIERGPEGGLQPVMGYTWLGINYTGKRLDGSVFVTRVDSISRRVGRFAYTTHYADDFVEYSSSSSKLCEGLRQAFETMREGDSVRVYIPLDKGYTSGMDVNSGYLGESGITYAQLPIVFEMRLKSVITSPFIWERDSAKRFAQKQWGTDFVNDTVGFFLHISKHNPEGDTITKDSSVYVFYEEYFMDGFLARTNVDTVAKKWKVYSAENANYDPSVILPLSGANVSTDKALYLAVPKMRKGEVAEVVVVSTWAQGDGGSASSTPEVLPYQPMRYRIHVMESWPLPKDDETTE